jgi:hypothetical protein
VESPLEGDELCDPEDGPERKAILSVSPLGEVCVCNIVGPGVRNVLLVLRELEMDICGCEEAIGVLEMVDDAPVVITDDGRLEELKVELSEPIFGSVLAPIDIGVIEDSICGRVTDAVFMRDDPLEVGTDKESVGLITFPEPGESEDSGDWVESVCVTGSVIVEDWMPRPMLEDAREGVIADSEMADTVE